VGTALAEFSDHVAGLRKQSKAMPQIAYGESAYRGQFPAMAYILSNTTGNQLIAACAATLVHPYFLLTAGKRTTAIWHSD
jgi:hypothetical protein